MTEKKAKFLGFTASLSNGFITTCKIAMPVPIRKKEIIRLRKDWKITIIAAPVTDNEKAKKIIFLSPTLSRYIPVGIENNP